MSYDNSVISTKDLVVSFSIKRGFFKKVYFNAVDHVTLNVRKGQIVALVGESGSGKTTFGKATLRLIKPTSGKVLYRGKDIWKLKGKEYKEYRLNAQYIPQDPYASIHPFKRVRTILGDLLKYHHMVSSKEELEGALEKLLERVGLSPPSRYIDKYPFELSGGERQRVAIAKAVALNPAYIVADEPVTMLDASIKAGIVNTLKSLVKEMGSSLLFITHEISLVEAFGSDTGIEIMYMGKIVERGTSRRIFSNPAHPYTQVLFKAVPIADPKRSREQKLILTNVNPPNPVNRPKGCIFSDRCPFATDRCKVEEPQMKEIEPDHEVACFLY